MDVNVTTIKRIIHCSYIKAVISALKLDVYNKKKYKKKLE